MGDDVTTPYSDAALKTEITTDPASMGYAGQPPQTVWQLLTDVTKARPVEVHAIAAFDLIGAMNAAELVTKPLPAYPHQWLIGLFLDALNHSAEGKVDPRDPRFVTLRDALFPTASYPQTNAALVALGNATGSRSEELWGSGFFPTLLQVQMVMQSKEKGTP